MSTKSWTDEKRVTNLRVIDLWSRKYEAERTHASLVRDYLRAATIPDADERRRERFRLNALLTPAWREVERAKHRYYSASAALRSMK